MIKELRIGNYLKAPLGELARVKQLGILNYPDFIKCDLLNEKGEINGFGQNGFEPIPLTPEVLLAAGFEMEDKRQSKQHTNYFSMWVIDYKYSFAYADFRGDWGFYHSYTDAGKDENNNRFDFISCGIKYLHQLQNLVHSLTGTELEIDITKLKQ